MGKYKKYRDVVRALMRGVFRHDRGDDVSDNTEHEVRELSDALLTRYERLASEIRGHLQYEKDFTGSDTLSKGFKDPFTVEPYGQKLLEMCCQLHKVYGKTVRSSDGESVDTMWIMLAQILHPSSESVRTILKRQLRIDLAGHVLVGLQVQSGEPMGPYIRGYYNLLYKTPVEVLESTHLDELAGLFKDSAKVADKLVADNQHSRKTKKIEDPDSERESSAGGERYLWTLMGRFNLVDKSKLEALTRPALPEAVVVAAMLIILFGALIVPLDVARYLGSVVPGLPSVIWMRVYPWIGTAAVLIVVWKTRSLTRRSGRQEAVRDAFHVLIKSGIVSQLQAEGFLLQFGYKNAKRFLKDI